MSSPDQQGDSDGHRESTMDFIETAQYNAPSSSSLPGNSSQAPLPYPWHQYRHPNGDIYFYNNQLRLITPDNVRDPEILEYIIDAREDHLQCLAGDPNLHRLPTDYELVVSDVSDTAAVIRMYSRVAGAAYTWTEERGLAMKSREHFWSHVAEYPSHHPDLPPNTEGEFVQSLNNAKLAIASGAVFPFSERQIDQIIARYQYLTAQRTQGRNVTPSLAWLAGAVMPLDAVGRRVGDQDLQALMNGSHF
ncbi:hypothetical protein GALMADRAFT_206051 [Galerina marginata CBS 339.88]|uniref:WW domain-containing protein n=1 Tax=Galerina marginata (strain CBS 339.88) TaxID=685588 RepID=A0A067TWT4_GALM3|nr:hypothetical protein GALMADRAFT_206051 [Galerina marginata CBS 339.88]